VPLTEVRWLYRDKWDDIHYEDDGVMLQTDKQVNVAMESIDV
jgi:hypothetical protein